MLFLYPGHRADRPGRHGNDLLGLFAGGLLLGLSFDWWVDKHTRHHTHPNHEDADPDIGDGALAFTARQVARRRGRFGRFQARSQAWLFFPLLTLEGVGSVRAVLTGHRHRLRAAEATLLAVHIIGYSALVLRVLSPIRALGFFVVQQGVFGLYRVARSPRTTKGMPTLAPDDELDYQRRQVLTSRNMRGSRVVDLMLGGLNYQIEHHLFPASHVRICGTLSRYARLVRRTELALHRDRPRRLIRRRTAPPARGRRTAARSTRPTDRLAALLPHTGLEATVGEAENATLDRNQVDRVERAFAPRFNSTMPGPGSWP